ncbi:MAG: choline kinase family protein [Halieaceae bacterium]|jgi:aminoglycoside phosphotransferase (APT) family kinase protein|nr:choline kinase family protein [Halieaceae bacterium]
MAQASYESLEPGQRDICERVIAAYDCWAPQEPRAPRPLRRLDGGYSNVCVLLAGEGACYVLRLPQGTQAPYVNRQRELKLQRLASAAGLAPAVLYCDTKLGLMLTPYIRADVPDGQRAPTSPPAIGTARANAGRFAPHARIEALARLLRRIHALSISPDDDGTASTEPPELDPQAVDEPFRSSRGLRVWRDRARERDPLDALSPAESATLERCSERIDRDAVRPRVCHNDLLEANCIASGGSLIAIDWEYASLGDPFFDLANTAAELADGDARALLRAYLEGPESAHDAQRFEDQRRLQAAIAACWHAARGQEEAVHAALERLRRLLTTHGAGKVSR